MSLDTAILYHPIFLKHNTGPSHPERASRIKAIFRKLRKEKMLDRLDQESRSFLTRHPEERSDEGSDKILQPFGLQDDPSNIDSKRGQLNLMEPYKAAIEDISRVHSKDYILSIENICKNHDSFNLDPDTVVSQDSYEASLFSSGATLNAVDLVMDRKIDNAFCIVRPPGHHARPNKAMGFCIFNNIAICARYIQNKYNLKKIAIIDWDVHHGNGTEEIFYKDKDVFYISLHEYPHYPGTGSSSDIGEGVSKNFNLNIPFSHGAGNKEYIEKFQNIIKPKLHEFRPEFILISAGFDGHESDPLSSINLTETGYYDMTIILKDAAKKLCSNRLVSVLEGGYNLISLANSVYSHLKALIE